MAYPAIVSYSWDFGDGSTSSQQNPSHVFASPGVYVVTLTIEDADGNTASRTVVVCAGYTHPTISSYSWDFGDGDSSAQQNPSHVYSGEARRVATLTIEDSEGNTASRTIPIASFLQRSLSSYSWDFGDGNVSAIQNPENIFLDAGFYSIVLTITDDQGDTAQKSFFLRVYGSKIRSRKWEFGDGFTSTQKNPRHVFMPGTYSVKLTVRDFYTNRGDITKEDFITVEGFSITGYPQTGTAPLTVKFGFSQ